MNRREILKNAAYAAALFGLPARGDTPTAAAPPAATLSASDPEVYWTRIREEQFLLPQWRAFLNNGSLGVAPKPVLQAVTDYLNRSAALMVEEYPRWGYELLDEHRTEVADYLGCKKTEIAFMHNATEAMSTIAAGLDLRPGDEVIITNQEHPSGYSGWRVREARHGIHVREVAIPLPPKSPEQITDVLISAIGPRTRVLSFSGITTTTGLILPIREICAAARAKGVLTVVDGAHVNGQIAARLEELGCDFYAGSPHKWMFAPAGCGILYAPEENWDRLWPTVVTARWDDKAIKAARFMMVGTNNRAIMEGMLAGVRFAKQIGPEKIYTRIHELSRQTYARAKQYPYLQLLTPEDDRMYGALVTFTFKDKDVAPLWAACKRKRIWTTESARLRIAMHIHTRPSDLDLFFETMQETLGKA